MAEENEVTKEPQQVQQKTQRVTTKDPKKVEAGKRLAAINHKKREEQAHKSDLNQYYGIGAVIAVGVMGGLGYYIYQTKKGEVPHHQPPNQPLQRPQTDKFEMDQISSVL